MATSRGGCTCSGQEGGHDGHDDERHEEKNGQARRRGWSARGPPPGSARTRRSHPTDSTVGPNDVFSTPASRRIGSRVPSAVVVRHSPTTTVSMTSPVPCRTDADAQRDHQRREPGRRRPG